MKDQFHLRIGLRHASSMGCRSLMGRENDAMLELPRFAAIYNAYQGEMAKNRQINLDDLDNFHERLDLLKELYPATIYKYINLTETELVSTKTSESMQSFSDGDVSKEW